MLRLSVSFDLSDDRAAGWKEDSDRSQYAVAGRTARHWIKLVTGKGV